MNKYKFNFKYIFIHNETMTTINEQKQQTMTTTNETTFSNPIFKVETYAGIGIIIEQQTKYINASQMCSSNGKAWRNFNKTKFWKNKVEAFNRSSFSRDSEGARISAPSITAKIGVKPEFQGEYIHPKLIHFVAEWCNDDYAFKVAELMDSINKQIHEHIERENIEDKPENTKPLFLSTVSTICDIMTKPIGQKEFEQQFCWGYRDIDTQGCEYFAVSEALNTLIKSRDYVKHHDKPLFDFMEERRMNEIQRLEQKKNKPKAIIDRLEFLKKETDEEKQQQKQKMNSE